MFEEDDLSFFVSLRKGRPDVQSCHLTERRGPDA